MGIEHNSHNNIKMTIDLTKSLIYYDNMSRESESRGGINKRNSPQSLWEVNK